MSDWRDILRAIDDLEWRNRPLTADYIAAVAHLKTDSVERLLEAALRQGYVERVGRQWMLTDLGRSEARS